MWGGTERINPREMVPKQCRSCRTLLMNAEAANVNEPGMPTAAPVSGWPNDENPPRSPRLPSPWAEDGGALPPPMSRPPEL